MFKRIGFTNDFSFLKSKEFYIILIVAQFFYLFLFFKVGFKIKSVNIFLIFIKAFEEEVIFRGVIQSIISENIQKKIFNITLANILTSFLFMGFHFYSHSFVWAISTFVPSLIFGYFRDRFNLYPSILLHFLFNLEYFYLF